MSSDPEDGGRAPSPVERMINALDEVRIAVDRMAGKTRTSDPQGVPDRAQVESSSPDQSLPSSFPNVQHPARRET